jgi:hypothetical protein
MAYLHSLPQRHATLFDHAYHLSTQPPHTQERGEAPKPFPSFYEVISNDEEATLKTIVQITTGITSIVDPVQASLEHFEKRYRKLWDQDKDAYMRRYEKAQKPLSSYEADVTEYNNKQVGCPHACCITISLPLAPVCHMPGLCCLTGHHLSAQGLPHGQLLLVGLYRCHCLLTG